jgi:hypothetical protein
MYIPSDDREELEQTTTFFLGSEVFGTGSGLRAEKDVSRMLYELLNPTLRGRSPG